MTRVLSGIMLSLASLGAYALEETAAYVPPPSDPTAMIGFAVVFFGGIGATAWFMWRNEKKNKQRKSEEQ